MQQVFYIQDPTEKMFHNVIHRLPRDWCDKESETRNEDDLTDSILHEIPHDSGMADQFGNVYWSREDVPPTKIKIPEI